MELLELMWEQIRPLWEVPALRPVAAGTALLGLGAGVVGSFAVLRRRSLDGDVIAHAALPGVMVAFLAGARTPALLLLGGILAAWIALWLVGTIVRQTRLKPDAVLAATLAVFFGLGIAVLRHLLAAVPDAGRHPLDRYLLGQAAQLRHNDVALIAVITTIAITLVIIFWNTLKLVVFDPEFAAGLGVRVRRWNLLLDTLTILVVAAGLKAVGVVLITALLVAPAVAARQWTDRLSRMVLLAAIGGMLAGVGGSLLAHHLSGRGAVPTGPTIVLTASGWVIISLLAVRVRQWLARRRTIQRIQYG